MVSGKYGDCLLCGISASCMGPVGRKAWIEVVCPDCGQYTITRDAIEFFPDNERQDPLLRNRIRRYLYESEPSSNLLISNQRFDEDGYVVLDLKSAMKLYSYSQNRSALEPLRETIQNVNKATKQFGQTFNSVAHRWLIATVDDDEADAILDQLFEDGYVTGSRTMESDEFRLTTKGLQYAEDLSAHIPHTSMDISVSHAGHTPSVFLSHSHHDDDFVEKLARDLHAGGIDVWYDGWDLDIGHNLTTMIQNGISESQYLAVILSPAAVTSAWVEKEWTTAFSRELDQRQVHVLPILYQNCDIPFFLKDKKYADFQDLSQYQQSLADLIRRLRGESKRPPRQETST